MSEYTVSIFMLTYNQESFIAQAIEGVLMQETNFKYQLVIGEDCSTDQTKYICEKFASQFPDKIKLLPTENNNVGLIANYMRTIKECDGKYIAICDGDDYWIDNFKLQKQVDFLEKNPDYSIVYTALKRQYPNGMFKDYNYHPHASNLNFNDLVFDNFIPSVTCLFKNEQSTNNQLPYWFLQFPFGDWQTYLWTIRKAGKIHFMDELTAVYRMEIGISSDYMKKNSSFIQILIKILENMLADENFKHKERIIVTSILKKKEDLITSFNRERAYCKSLIEFAKILFASNQKLKLIKFYFYSVFKSFSK